MGAPIMTVALRVASKKEARVVRQSTQSIGYDDSEWVYTIELEPFREDDVRVQRIWIGGRHSFEVTKGVFEKTQVGDLVHLKLETIK